MSLLMDALKKAEKAKQGPNSVFGDPPPSAPPAGGGPPTIWPELTIDPRPAELEAELGLAQPPVKPATTPRAAPATPLALDPLPPPAAIEEPARPDTRAPEPRASEPAASRNQGAAVGHAASGSRESADRIAAKRVFAAKQPGASSNPRMPFFGVLGALLLAGAGGAYYVWTETQSPPSLTGKGPATSAAGAINPGPAAAPPVAAPVAVQAPAPSPTTPSAPAATPAPAPVVASAQTPTTTSGPEPLRPKKPTPSTEPVPAALAPQSAPPPGRTAQVPREDPPQNPNPPAVAAVQAGRNGVSARGGTPVNTPSNLRITRDRPGPGVDPAVSAGYAALSEGNLETAREHYNRALEADNTNRDALLGLAAIASRSGRRDIAENMYRRVLELQPRDPYATAQLTALHNSADTASAESRVKALLANEREPAGAAPLQFALGNQMAAQGRWAEAQQAYFTAYTAESDNPDYCYNLAVSLDQLHQTKLAQDFYAKALSLSSNRRAGFDPARAKARLEQLANSAK